MRYYPVLLELRDKKCLIAGGGNVAQRKASSLLKAGARVWIVSPRVTKALTLLKEKKKIFHIPLAYHKKYLKGSFLVIAATDNEKLNMRVAEDARSLGVLVNAVDSPAISSFIVPSVISKKGVIISISTSGQAPCLSKRMRKDLSTLIVPEYGVFLKKLKEIRNDLKLRCRNPRLRAEVLHRLVNAKL